VPLLLTASEPPRHDRAWAVYYPWGVNAVRVILAVMCMSCGARTSLGDVGGETKSATSETRCPRDYARCAPVEFRALVAAACEVAADCPDAKGFGNDVDTSAPHLVLAMTRWGRGHVVAHGDQTELGDLLTSAHFDWRRYLGGRSDARVASVGYRLCQPGSGPFEVPSWVHYLGTHLPAEYVEDASALAADFDVLIECAWDNSEVSTPPATHWANRRRTRGA
jgi:hypothetical protein